MKALLYKFNNTSSMILRLYGDNGLPACSIPCTHLERDSKGFTRVRYEKRSVAILCIDLDDIENKILEDA
jgi:hypothetical protein